MVLSEWLTLCAICLLGAASPGPSLAVVLQSTLTDSPRAGVATALGHGCGVTLYALLTVCGLGIVVSGLPALYAAIKLAGAAYLIWLAFCAWHAGQPGTGETSSPGRTGFLRGALVALLNPKLAIFMLALFSQFLAADAGVLHGAILVITAGAIDALWYTAIALVAGRLGVQRALAQRAVALNRSFALLLTALALWVMATTI